MSLLGFDISGRDLILIVGGLFLIGKATYEIHDKLEGEEGHASARVPPSFNGVIERGSEAVMTWHNVGGPREHEPPDSTGASID